MKIIGYTDMPSRVCNHASQLYAKNLLNFVTPLINQKLGRIKIDFEDEIVQNTLITYDGKVIHPGFKTLKPTKPTTPTPKKAELVEPPVKEKAVPEKKPRKTDIGINKKQVKQHG